MIEIAIALLMIAIVLAFALPAVSKSIRAYNLRSAAERIAERLAGGRALAMSKNKNVTVSFNATAKSYGYDFTPVGAPDGTPDTSDPDDTSQSYYVETTPSGVDISFPGSANILVTFTSRGELPIGATQKDIALSNSSNSMTVSVNLRGQVWAH